MDETPPTADIPPVEQPQQRTTPIWVILVVAIFVICCCCLALVLAGNWLWFNGDRLFGYSQILTSAYI